MDITYIIAFVCAIASITFFIMWQKEKRNSAVSLSQLDSLHSQMKKIEEVRDQALLEVVNEREGRIEAETKVKLAEQDNLAIKERIGDWEKTKEQHFEAAKASMLKTSQEMSSKLLDDHKRETDAAKKESDKRIKETTEELHKNFRSVFESVKSLNDRVKPIEVIRSALLNPSGAGSIAEITLENVFKASGLVENQDYQMQYWISDSTSGSGLKPDAIVYLPDNNIMVVDSKASKFFMEIGEVNENIDNIDNTIANSKEKKALHAKLKVTMNNHLKDLMKRDYKNAIEGELKKSGRIDDLSYVTVLMFVPTDSALTTLRLADPNFIDKAWKERIFPVSPNGLVNMLLLSKMLIANEKQERNSQEIVNEVKGLLTSISKLHNYADGMGKGIKSAFKKYDEFSASFNRTFLSKAKKLEQLGVESPKGKSLQKLERYHIASVGNIIEGESEEVQNIKELEKAS